MDTEPRAPQESVPSTEWEKQRPHVLHRDDPAHDPLGTETEEVSSSARGGGSSEMIRSLRASPPFVDPLTTRASGGNLGADPRAPAPPRPRPRRHPPRPHPHT